MEYLVINKIGPYNGPYAKNIITYKLKRNDGLIVAWHEGPNKKLGAQMNDIITGVILNKDNSINYGVSNPVIKQLKLW